MLPSCLKKHTCQCYDSTGFSPGPSSLISTSRKENKQFKENCLTSDVIQKSLGGYCTYK